MFPPDSDEEIFVSKKTKSRKALQDSDSEAEDRDASPEKPTYDSEEENKENLHSKRNRKVKSLSKTLADGDESNMEGTVCQENPDTQDTPSLELSHQSGSPVDLTTDRKLAKKLSREGTEGKAKAKSKRRLEKEERTMEKIRRLKKKETRYEVCCDFLNLVILLVVVIFEAGSPHVASTGLELAL